MRFKSLYVWIGIPVIVVIVWFLVFYMPMKLPPTIFRPTSKAAGSGVRLNRIFTNGAA